ncbi:uncharacterized protein LOC132747146, partial [Ruditapes philippinarum]|uniref:uncharacterized protein LOC132747146 n=1 Tax=Ruditapes philippinarum TaxID=129788 RepID=UPI00295A89FE
APDVTVNVSSLNPTENYTLTVKCEPEGRPADYHFSSIVHKWGDVVISKILNPTNGVIEVQNAQLQDSGTYICVANNGIRDRKQKLDQSGNNTVKVKVSPKMLLKITDRIFAGAPMTTVNITAPFYSDPPPQTVQFKFQNGTMIINSSKHAVSFYKGNVKDMFYGKEVEIDGYFAQLQIKNEEESDFVNYNLVIDNGIGSYKSWILKHVSQSKPLVPRYFNYTGLKDGIPTFRLVGNFNGGLLQTFIIETTEVGKDNWVERLKFNETDTAFLQAEKLTFTFNISGLQPNVYDARVRTGNDIGWINETDALTIQFTITEENEGKSGPPGTVAAIAGGVASAGCVIILAIVLVFVWKKRSKSKDDRSDVLNKRHRADSDSSEDNVMTENLAYVSADEVGRDRHMGATPENLYAQPQKKSKSATGTGDIYSSVQKGKKEDSSNIYALPNKKDKKNQKKDVKKDKNDKGGKKGKDKKQDRKDDVYENASELAPIKTKTYAGEENVYENPEQSKSTPKVNRNKDGLIYADLAFNDQPKGQKKLVIHGLDDMTEYVQVDFTKKADPLPDSDEEESTPKK